MYQTHYTTARQGRGQSPLWGELTRVYQVIDDTKLIDRLSQYRWTGRPGHDLRALWKAYVAAFILNLPTTNALIRRLQEDSTLRRLCGFHEMPSRWTFNRFFIRLSKHLDLVEECLHANAKELARRLPRFGCLMAVDSSVIPTHCNPNRQPRSDQDASWTVKEKGHARGGWHFGYRLHLAADAETEIPITGYVVTAAGNDFGHLLPLMDKAAGSIGIRPQYVLADAGYDAIANYEGAVERGATPIIQLNRRKDRGKGKSKSRPSPRTMFDRESRDWKMLYGQRQAVERCFSRLKLHRTLDRHCRRSLAKVTLHCLLGILAVQACAIARIETQEMTEIRRCTRKVA